jgi:hypothetical protein
MAYTPWVARRFGVEMETQTRRRSGGTIAASTIHTALVDAIGYTRVRDTRVGNWGHSNGQRWEVKSDITAGWEVATAALTLDADGENEELRDGCRALAALDPVVDRRCGLHVHVDVSDFDWKELKQLVAMWMRYEPFFYEMCAPSRRANTYAKAVRKTTWEGTDRSSNNGAKSILDAKTYTQFRSRTATFDKYHSLRVNQWAANGRVEFRLHGGSVNYEKIRNWVRVVLTVVARIKSTRHRGAPKVSRRMGAKPNTMSTYYMARVLGLTWTPWTPDEAHPVSRELVEWMHERRVKFNPPGSVKKTWYSGEGGRPSRRTTNGEA